MNGGMITVYVIFYYFSVVNSKIKISYRKRKIVYPLLTSDDVYRFFMKIWDKGTIELQEQFYILCLDRDNCVICHNQLNKGCANHITISLKLSLCCAIGSGAEKIIVGHNHPSGDVAPSDLDITFTEQLKAATGVIGIELVDHIILSKYGYYSFKGGGAMA